MSYSKYLKRYKLTEKVMSGHCVAIDKGETVTVMANRKPTNGFVRVKVKGRITFVKVPIELLGAEIN